MAGVNYRETTLKKVRFSSPSESESRLGKGEIIDSRLSGSENEFNILLSDYISPRQGVEKGFREISDKIVTKPSNDLDLSIFDQSSKDSIKFATKPSHHLDLSIFDHGSKDSVKNAKENILHQAFTNKNTGKKHNNNLELSIYDSSRDSVTVAKQTILQQALINKDIGKRIAFPKKVFEKPCLERIGGITGRQNVEIENSAAKPQNVLSDEQKIDDSGFFVRPPNFKNKYNAAFKQLENPQTSQTRPCYEEAERDLRRQQFLDTPVVYPKFPENYYAGKPQNVRHEEQKIDHSGFFVRPPNSQTKDNAVKHVENPQTTRTRPSYEVTGRDLQRQELPAMPFIYPMFPESWRPEMPFPYFYGYPDNRPIICPRHKSNNTKTKRQDKIFDNGVKDKVDAIMSKQRIEETKKEEVTDVRSSNEPTVKDLFEIIKKQNDRLEHLYEKVDRLLEKGVKCSHEKCEQECCNSKDLEIIVPNELPSQDVQHPKTAEVNGIKEQLHQMSIGVMTSFEMVMTSTRHFPDPNAFYPQKNITRRSEIAIQKTGTSEGCQTGGLCPQRSTHKNPHIDSIVGNVSGFTGKSRESSKNENSFSNIMNLENYPSRQLSPEPSLHLDMKDYSGIGSADISHSERGWTYFNKVVNNVDDILSQPNGVTPQSHGCGIKHLGPRFTGIAARTIDISVCSGQREKIGPTCSYPKPHFQPLSETSIRINQLAKKYLKIPPDLHKPIASTNKYGKENTAMDYAVGATQEKMQYIERQRYYAANNQPCERNCRRFCHTREATLCDSPSNILDIQALKQQPKFL